MVDRVGRSRKRFPRTKRKKQIVGVVKEQCKFGRRATCTSVAKRLGIAPSTHLMAMLNELYWDCVLDREFEHNSKGNGVFYFTLGDVVE